MSQYSESQFKFLTRTPKVEEKRTFFKQTIPSIQQNFSKSYRKIPKQNNVSYEGKENNFTSAKSSRNIRFAVTQNDDGKETAFTNNLGKSCVNYPSQYNQNLTIESRSKSRWETTDYVATSKSFKNINIDEMPVESNYDKYEKYKNVYKYNNEPVNALYTSKDQNYTSKYNNDWNNNQERGSEEYKKKYNKMENKTNLVNSKSSKNIGFYDRPTTIESDTPFFKDLQKQKSFMNNTFSSYKTQNSFSIQKSPLLMDQSMGGAKFKKITQSYSKKNITFDSESKSKKTIQAPEVQFKKAQSKKQQQTKEPCLDDFIVGDFKGEGRFGKVYMAIHKTTGLVCALKKIKKDSIKYMLDQFIQQIKIQMYLNHPKLVKMYGYFADSEYFYMLIEYMEDGSLYSLMKKAKKLEENDAAEKVREICQGIKEMHDSNIVHRDLKPENVVISHGVCKICDFGWAAVCEDRRQTYCGTLDYVCPEIVQGADYDSSADIWCIGILAYELMCGKAPFYDISRKKTMEKIKTGKIQSYPSHLSQTAIQFIEMILQKNPDHRVGIDELLSSKFLKSGQK